MGEWLQATVSTSAALLPEPAAVRLYGGLAWGLVLAALLAWGLQRRAAFAGWRRLLPALLLLWCLLPGPATPAFVLGLAFRLPSLLLAAWAAWVLWRAYRAADAVAAPAVALRPWALPLSVLGWLLLLDTLALLPGVQLYAWGFAPLTLAVAALAAALPWVLGAGLAASALPAVALLLFMALRLPSGNFWDALLDPWLWLALQILAGRQLLARWRAQP